MNSYILIRALVGLGFVDPVLAAQVFTICVWVVAAFVVLDWVSP